MEIQVRSLGWEGPLENKMATQSDSSLEYSMDRGGWWVIIMVSERIGRDLWTKQK